jgi:hypothetical protein
VFLLDENHAVEIYSEKNEKYCKFSSYACDTVGIIHIHVTSTRDKQDAILNTNRD